MKRRYHLKFTEIGVGKEAHKVDKRSHRAKYHWDVDDIQRGVDLMREDFIEGRSYRADAMKRAIDVTTDFLNKILMRSGI